MVSFSLLLGGSCLWFLLCRFFACVCLMIGKDVRVYVFVHVCVCVCVCVCESKVKLITHTFTSLHENGPCLEH